MKYQPHAPLNLHFTSIELHTLVSRRKTHCSCWVTFLYPQENPQIRPVATQSHFFSSKCGHMRGIHPSKTDGGVTMHMLSFHIMVFVLCKSLLQILRWRTSSILTCLAQLHMHINIYVSITVLKVCRSFYARVKGFVRKVFISCF